MLFSTYLKQIRSKGRRSFTLKEAMTELNMSRSKILAAIGRRKKQSELISPAKGLYVIVPPEHQPLGGLPAEELTPILMEYLGINYYVGLLTAAMFYGASHQKSAFFQIITERRFGKKLKFGKVCIEFIYKKSLEGLPTQNFTVNTGNLKLSSPEITAIDLLLYPHKCGGINHIATVLSELVESITVDKLIDCAARLKENACIQRLGYILECIEPMDEIVNQKIIAGLSKYLSSKKLRYVPLAPEISTKGFSRSKKWKIIENTTVESDI